MAKKQNEQAAVSEFSTRFPKLAGALALYGGEAKEMAASFPRLLSAIENGWGTDGCYEYINNLLLPDRPDRQGFSGEVIDELLLIKNVFEVAYPKLTVNPYDPFSSIRAADIQHKIEVLSEQAATGKNASEGQGASPGKVRSRLPQAKPDEVSTIEELQQRLSRLDQGIVPLGKDRKLIGEYLVEAGVIDAAAVSRALSYQSKSPVRHLLGEYLVSDGIITPHQLNRALSRQRGIPIVDVASMEISTEAVRLVPIRIARLKEAMPIALIDHRLVVAVPDPFNAELQEYFSFLSGTRAVLVYATPERIAAAQGSYGHVDWALNAVAGRLGHKDSWADGERGADGANNGAGLMRSAETDSVSDGFSDEDESLDGAKNSLAKVDENDETVIGLVNKVINDAIRVGASDIHFEAFPRSRNAQIRFRKDGTMEAHSEYPIAYHAAVVSRLKIMAELDISERRKSQDGKIGFGQGSKKLDLRVSTIPTSNALETVTVRLLSSGKPMPLSRIGMHPTSLEVFRNEIVKPYGLILVCGPTGSGKTTTLHSVLRELNTPERKIWTAEDPVEIVQKNISQVQVRPKIGWTFANALRAFLRADPDVIMIGEIRDTETAKVAVEASMTGHLVLSTLHTNSAAETLARLLDLDVAAFNLADAVLAVLAQRLARRVCTDCGERYEFNKEELDTLVNEYYLAGEGKAPAKTQRDRLLARWRSEFNGGAPLSGLRAAGCSVCNGSGYRGRLGIHELLVVTPEIRRLIRAEASTGDILHQAFADGLKTLRQDGIEKVVQGLTDLKEVRMVCL